jgi:hypothetical protein
MSGPVRDFLGTPDGEWVVSGGDFAAVAGPDAVPQGIRIRLQLFLAECYLDEAKGTDYLGVILVKDFDPLVVRAELASQIADTPDVINVIGAELIQSDNDRGASISYTCDTVYSQQPFAATVATP